MALQSGEAFPSNWTETTTPHISDNIDEAAFSGFGGASIVPFPTTGPKTGNQPITLITQSHNGEILWMFSPLLYQGIHVIPNFIDVGNMLQPESHQVEVWNATDENQDLSAIDELRTEGIALTEPAPPPTTFVPLESRFYDVNVSLDGPGRINAVYTFQFVPNQPTLTIVGWRIVVLGLEPDWSRSVIEHLSWLTDLIESHDGTEQRIQLRGVPRRGYEFKVTQSGHKARHLTAMLYAWQSRVYGLPIWMDGQRLQADVPAGSTEILLDPQYLDYTDGGLAVVWVDSQAYEVVQISTVETDRINLEVENETAWPESTWIFPLRLARIPSAVKLVRPSDDIVQAVLNFEIQPGTPMGGIEGPTPPQYQGFDVLLDSSHWSADLADEMNRAVQEVDFMTGAESVFTRIDHPKTMTPFTWILDGRAEISAFKKFLEGRQGRLTPVWIPTWQSDLELNQPIAAIDSSVAIKAIEYERFFGTNEPRRDLAFMLPDRTWRFRRVVGVAAGAPGEEILTLDTAWGDDVQPVRISFLNLCRLNQDRVEIDWLSGIVARSVVGRVLVKG